MIQKKLDFQFNTQKTFLKSKIAINNSFIYDKCPFKKKINAMDFSS